MMASKNALPLIILSLIVGVLTTIPKGVESIGVCYGMNGDDLPSPSDAVNLYVSNGIKAMRLYAPNGETLDALKGKGIDVMMGVDDGTLKDFATDPSVAANWVRANIVAYPTVSFKYIVVGNEVPLGDAHNDILPAMSKMWDAISSAGYNDKIKVSTALRFDVFTDTSPPSNAKFDPSYNMGPILYFLSQTGNPLFVNIYPYFSYKGDPTDIKPDYALFTAPGTEVHDGQYEYQNLFDAMVDSVYYALEKAGYPDVGVVVSESGWPSNGGFGATVENAQTYNQNLIKHVGNGTPKRRGNLETYIFAMFNENKKEGDPVEKFFGLFKPGKTPVYSITFN